jgi:hypothetical protein
MAVEGADCKTLGIVEAKHFCIVNPGRCVDTSYAVRDHDCRVVRYEMVSDGDRADCASGTPTFVDR